LGRWLPIYIKEVPSEGHPEEVVELQEHDDEGDLASANKVKGHGSVSSVSAADLRRLRPRRQQIRSQQGVKPRAKRITAGLEGHVHRGRYFEMLRAQV